MFLQTVLLQLVKESNYFDNVKIIGGNIPETGAVSGMSTQLARDEVSDINFEGSQFCLTGAFIYGTRTECKSVVQSQGGIIHKDVIRATNYLVVGTLASRDWKNTTHGRKIEKAIKLKESGYPILILHEDQWVQFLT